MQINPSQSNYCAKILIINKSKNIEFATTKNYPNKIRMEWRERNLFLSMSISIVYFVVIVVILDECVVWNIHLHMLQIGFFSFTVVVVVIASHSDFEYSLNRIIATIKSNLLSYIQTCCITYATCYYATAHAYTHTHSHNTWTFKNMFYIKYTQRAGSSWYTCTNTHSCLQRWEQWNERTREQMTETSNLGPIIHVVCQVAALKKQPTANKSTFDLFILF